MSTGSPAKSATCGMFIEAWRLGRDVVRLGVALRSPRQSLKSGVWGEKTLQFCTYLCKYAVPLARHRLPKNLHCWVPRTVVPLGHPAPACIEAVEQPHRLAERARQMRHGGVDRDHQVELID